jgi:phosphatidylglycerophosphatase A
MKYFIGTTFYSSLLWQRAPGTISSLLVFVVLALFPIQNPQYTFILIGILLALHFISFPAFLETEDDPAIYTLDETVAMVGLNIPFHDQPYWLIAFLLFRFFDIVKPLGIRSFEKLAWLPLSVRNVGDDCLAAVYTFVIIWCFQYAF